MTRNRRNLCASGPARLAGALALILGLHDAQDAHAAEKQSAPKPKTAPAPEGRLGDTTAPAAVPAAAGSNAPADSNAPAGSVQAGVQALSDSLANRLTADSKHYQRLAVLPFETLDGEAKTKELGRLSSELLASRLSLRPGILQVERSRLDAVVSELQRSEQGEVSAVGAASVGKLLGANQVVLGSIASAGPNYVLTARLVDAETGQVLAASDQNISREGLIALSEDLVEIKSPGGAALRSTAVPGWGQIYNGDTTRGVTYIALFFGAAATAGTSAWLGKSAEDEYHQNEPGTVDRRSDANGHFDRANYALLGGGVLWVASIVDAWLTGRDVRIINLPESGGGSQAAR